MDGAASSASCEMRPSRSSTNPIREEPPWDDDLERASDAERATFVHWYPDWDTWKFRRTLSYWIAIMFLEGSFLFIVGGAFSMSGLAEGAAAERALVGVPYLFGGVCFTLGAYAGVVEVLNVPYAKDPRHALVLGLSPCDARGQWRTLRRHLSWEPLVGYAAYIVGALVYDVNVVAGMIPGANRHLIWGAAIVGSILFTVGGWVGTQLCST